MTSDSESALSDAVDDPSSLPPNFNVKREGILENNNSGGYRQDSSQEEDALGSEDPDFDSETPPPRERASPRDDRSTSQDSPRQRKRKLGTEDEEHILDNPELYGLRRSVRISSLMMLNG